MKNQIMMNSKAYPVLLALLIISCQNREKPSSKLLDKGTAEIHYDVFLDYNEKPLPRKMLSRDTIVVFFESGFNGEEVGLWADKQEYLLKRISTDEIDGVAEAILIPNASNIQSINFRVDGGSKVLIEADSLQRMFGIRYYPDSGYIYVKSYHQAPRFD